MKRKTILKTIGWFIGWIISFQLIPVGTHLMNQPSSIAFTFGILMSVATIGTVLYFAWNTGGYVAKLLREYLESKEVKQNKKEEL
jgi:putative effector of murein hydrolase LrgA (UPF0299 family)